MSGADFGSLAIDNSDDVGTKADSGFLPPSPRGAFVPPFDSAAWLLEPGQMSGVVVTSYGFHVLKRASDAQAKARIAPWLQEPLIQAMEQSYFAEVDSVNHIEVKSGATARAREAIADLDGARDNSAALASYDGGKLTVAEFARWVQAQTQDPTRGPQQLQAMQQLPDSSFEMAIKAITSRTLMLRDAAKNGVHVTPEEWQAINTQFQMAVDTLKAQIGMGPDVIDPQASEADRRRAAALRVDDFFNKMVTGESRLRLLPGMLAWTLRGDAEAKINPAGVQQAVDLAQATQAAKGAGVDSTGAAPAAAPPPAITPAPGGPPVPGGN
jgi:hypothetical protein